MSNNNILFASIMLAILATSILALNPSTITNAQAMPYGSEDYYDYRYSYGDQYGYDSNYYYQDDNRYSYDKKDLKSYGDIQKISCVNSNINVNGIDITQIPEDNIATAAANEGGADAASAQNENGFDKINFNRNLVNICVNVNTNEQIHVTEPEPETASLTVNKQVFGCNNIVGEGDDVMLCGEVDNGQDFPDVSFGWRPCTTDPPPSPEFAEFCQNLPANLFDIEVLDDQNTQLQQFKGSAQGTTIQNLQPGTYAVNEIKNPNSIMNQLGVSTTAEEQCVDNQGFPDAGRLNNTNTDTLYQRICFEYEDEQGNDCSTVTLAAGENKLCTVKNYISLGTLQEE